MSNKSLLGINKPDIVPRSSVRLSQYNGYGSVGTFIRRYLYSEVIGSDITYLDDPALGATMIINTPGVYAAGVSSQNKATSGVRPFGISKNATATEIATALTSIDESHIIGYSQVGFDFNGGAESMPQYSAFFIAKAGDVVRSHVNTAGAYTGIATQFYFYLTRVS